MKKVLYEIEREKRRVYCKMVASDVNERQNKKFDKCQQFVKVEID